MEQENAPHLSRRNFLKAVEISAGVISLSAQPLSQKTAPLAPGKGITNNLRSPHMKLRSVDMDSVRWTSGLWAERFDTCANATIQHLWHEMEGVHYANSGCWTGHPSLRRCHSTERSIPACAAVNRLGSNNRTGRRNPEIRAQGLGNRSVSRCKRHRASASKRSHDSLFLLG